MTTPADTTAPANAAADAIPAAEVEAVKAAHQSCFSYVFTLAEENLRDAGQLAGLPEFGAEYGRRVDAEAAYYLQSGVMECTCAPVAEVAPVPHSRTDMYATLTAPTALSNGHWDVVYPAGFVVEILFVASNGYVRICPPGRPRRNAIVPLSRLNPDCN